MNQDSISFLSQEALPTNGIPLFYDIFNVSSHLSQIEVVAPANIVNKIFDLTVELCKSEVQVSGFNSVPGVYLKEHYKNEIEAAVKSFLLHYFILDFVIEKIIETKVHMASYPRLIKMNQDERGNILFLFDISLANKIEIKEWKYFPFKPPRRKNYKDLDKQVDIFLRKELECTKKSSTDTVEPGDWICFEALLVDRDKNVVFDSFKQDLWIRVDFQSFADIANKYFIGKKEGDSFIIDYLPISKGFEDNLFEKHSFLIKIKEVVKGNVFLLSDFKINFKLKNKVEMHEKLVEVFSFRNDISQRRAIIEEMFHIFFSKHRFEVPKHLVIRKQEDLLAVLKNKPDYSVYKQNKDFEDQVERLAERILKEEILIDQIASSENMEVDSKDIKCYLNLLCNSRLKEFIYFKPGNDLFEEGSIPVKDVSLKQICRREKTLNFILYTLTK
ncbi:TPA: hypothetical protein DEO28_05220 [Candidatus Dependentiae bacterium]|nr:MAG: hypothetical protein UR14_C0002G0155 [candidate division TM6 bacterium GW2011_GWE2_31_21]KKP53952.1 MAG: hypothetical protein UR43_C0002G0155 [candidate division TM6 bacterium GW2011_GWF2_33_332]HBS47732.1 hypothetical protein [Candidatus Dependentiae bacterium]HBZ73881.1 hypothetical protein [Candidatus Dependentiae bacterium]